jgi:hypothetical protein
VVTFQQYETTMDLFWQVIRMTKKGFGMALIRIRYCPEIKDEISSSFVLPFVWFTRTGRFLNSTPQLLARDRRVV